MTHIFASSSRLALAIGFALAMASSLPFLAKADTAATASAPATSGVRCFIGAWSDPKHGPLSQGWICLPERHSTDEAH